MAISLPLRARLAAQKMMQPRGLTPKEGRANLDPAAPIIWIRIAKLTEAVLYEETIEKLMAEDPELQVLLSVDGFDDDGAITLQPRHAILQTPGTHPQEVKEFLAEWTPELILWSGSDVPLAVLERAQKLSIPVINTEVTFDQRTIRKMRMLSSYYRASFKLTGAVIPRDQASYEALTQIGVSHPVLRKPAAMKRGVRALPYEEASRNRVVKGLGHRTVWLAEAHSIEEVDLVIRAHMIASKLTHRLLLVLVAEPAFTDHLCNVFDQSSFSLHQQAKGEFPTQDTHVFVVENRDNQGLWFRVAPLSFLGGFDQVANLTNPLNAANFGSAIVFGPRSGAHEDLYKELMTAGAAVQVNTAESLAEAVCQLSFPDRAAAMAHAGWLVSTEGAETTDNLVALINDHMYPELADAS
jgi:3-deoxy-D-manno-octulosonic-acid transferase